MTVKDPRYAEKRRAAIHAKDVATLNARIPAYCPLTVRGERFAGYWSFYTNTGKGPMRFEVAMAYIDGYVDAGKSVAEAAATLPPRE